MNIKRYFAASICLYLFIYIYEFFVHGKLLVNLYLQTPNIWRNYKQMMAYVPFNIVIMGIIAFWSSFIFIKFFPRGGLKNGFHFGFYIGILSGIQAAGAYYYLPVSATLAFIWFIANFIETMIGGVVIGLIYRK